MECFVIIVNLLTIITNRFQPLTIITNRSILDLAAALDPPLILCIELELLDLLTLIEL